MDTEISNMEQPLLQDILLSLNEAGNVSLVEIGHGTVGNVSIPDNVNDQLNFYIFEEILHNSR